MRGMTVDKIFGFKPPQTIRRDPCVSVIDNLSLQLTSGVRSDVGSRERHWGQRREVWEIYPLLEKRRSVHRVSPSSRPSYNRGIQSFFTAISMGNQILLALFGGWPHCPIIHLGSEGPVSRLNNHDLRTIEVSLYGVRRYFNWKHINWRLKGWGTFI